VFIHLIILACISFISPFRYSFAHSSINSIVRQFIHLFVCSIVCSFSCMFVLSFIQLFIYSFVNSFIYSILHSHTCSSVFFIRLFVYSLVCEFVRSFIYLFVRSFLCSFIRSFLCIFLCTVGSFKMCAKYQELTVSDWSVDIHTSTYSNDNSVINNDTWYRLTDGQQYLQVCTQEPHTTYIHTYLLIFLMRIFKINLQFDLK